ncbi:MAG: hypothetical protein JXQ27_04770 [Acidobacteria bacterium]|nr:hypothetical protein [Acidobacteriota bacterium]
MRYGIILALIVAVGFLWVLPATTPETQATTAKTEVKSQEAETATDTTPTPRGPRYKDENRNDVCDHRESGNPQGRMYQGGRQGKAAGPGQGLNRPAGAGQQWRFGRGRCCGWGRGRGMGRVGMVQGQGNAVPGRGQGIQLRKRDGSCLTQTESKEENPPEIK